MSKHSIDLQVRLNSSRQEFAVEVNLAPISRKNRVNDTTSFCLQNCDKISRSVMPTAFQLVTRLTFWKLNVFRFLSKNSRKQSRPLEKSIKYWFVIVKKFTEFAVLGTVFWSYENKRKSIIKCVTSHLLSFQPRFLM